jgi:hypothetical protein
MICVAHLVRKANGLEPLETFLASYNRFGAGAEHELVLLLKGFESPADADVVLTLADGVAAGVLHLPDAGFDIGSYMTATRELVYDDYCFLNSFSVIRSDGWLGKLAGALGGDVGLVGASGSWTSHYSFISYHLAFGPYRTLLRSSPARLEGLEDARVRDGVVKGPIRHAAWAAVRLPVAFWYYESFPAYHVRTNAFLVPRRVIRSVRSWRFGRKVDAWRFESGRRCLLRQVEGMGLRAAVVAADGRVFDKTRWHESNTFWQAEQENLMVEDNQSRDYRDGDATRRLYLSVLAWGDHANPTIPVSNART